MLRTIRRQPKAICGLLAAVLLSGCGGGSAPAPQVAVPPPPPPTPVAVAAKPAAVKPAPPAAPTAGNQSPASRNVTSQFPGEDASNVFIAASPGIPMRASPAPSVNPEDRFAVRFGKPGTDSTQFQVAATVAVSPGTRNPDFELPDGFDAVAQYGYSSDGYPLRIRGETDGKMMAFVPGGSVRVGSNSGPAEASPQFVAFLEPFYMDVTEVTVEEFEKYRQSQRTQKKRVPPPPENADAHPSFPVLGIAWGDATTYARWAGKELPTEAQFELAARGPDGFTHPWGDGRPVWPTPRKVNTITAVGLFRGDVSPYGIYDLAGNAREWVQDWYSPSAHKEAARLAEQKALTNWDGPRKAAQGSQRVIKGCGPNWEVWYRSGSEMHERMPDVGFRCVLRIKPLSAPATGAG